MARKKPKLNARVPKPLVVDASALPWHKKAWPWVTAILVVCGWILMNGITALDNAGKLPSATASLYEKVSLWYRTDKDWTGRWTNEGDVDARNQPDVYVDLDILVQNGLVQGTISSGRQQESIPLQFVLLEGSVNDDTLDVLAFDFFQGYSKRIATFKITKLDSGGLDQINVVTTWQAESWFPEETILWRSGESEFLSTQD